MRTSFGLFTEPLSDVRGFDRETFAFAIAIQNLLWGLGQPVAGAIADRYGSGRVLACGGLLYVARHRADGGEHHAGALALTGGVLIGLGLAGGSFMIVLAAFARLVPEQRRSWAMGLATAAGSLGQFLFAPLGQALHLRLRRGHRAHAALGLRVARPAARARIDRARRGGTRRSRGLRARGARGAMSHPSYLLLTARFFVCGFHIAFVSTHLPPYLGDLGFSGALAAGPSP